MTAEHLDEDQIMVSIVDENDLPVKFRKHLEVCPACRERQGALTAQLEEMGHMAGELAPRPRAVSLPEPKVSWGLSFSWPVVASGLASLLIIAAVWSLLLFQGPQTPVSPGSGRQRVVGLASIDDILEESALPVSLRDMTLVSYDYFDEGFLDFVVPLEGSQEKLQENTSFNQYDTKQREA